MSIIEQAIFPKILDRYAAVQVGFRRFNQAATLYELKSELRGSKRVIVPASKMVQGQSVGVLKEVFLERQTRSGNWIASSWPRTVNPWVNNSLPSVGTTLNGTVSGFIEDFAAVVDIEHDGFLLEFTVSKEDLPANMRTRNIREILFKGDRVAGRMVPASRTNLRLSLDVKTWVENLERYWRTASQYHMRDEHFTSLELQNTDASQVAFSLEGKNVLIVEDSVQLSETISSSLKALGCATEIANEISQPSLFEKAMSSFGKTPDIILLDYQLEVGAHEQKRVFEAVQRLKIENPNLNVLVISGNLGTAPKYAQEFEFGYMSKPVSPYEICCWVNNPIKFDATNSDTAERKQRQLFSVESKTVQVVKKTNQLLEKICDRHHLLGAVWFIEVTPDRYELRAHSDSLSGAVTKVVVDSLRHSIVGNAMESEDAIHGLLSVNDPLYNLAPRASRSQGEKVYFFSFSLRPEGENPRVLVFFSSTRISEETRDQIRLREDHFELLMETITQAEAIDEISASASIGRVALGTIHEIRTELAAMLAVLSANEAIYSDDVKIKLLQGTLPRAVDLSKESLSQFRPMSRAKINLVASINNVCIPLRRYIRDKFPDTVVEVLTDLSDLDGINIYVNPIPIERAVINLIDNAADFCSQSNISKVWVTGKRNFKADPKRPIEISVSDTGPGLNTLARRRLFRPRVTERPMESTGLGLYLTRALLSEIDATIECQIRPRWSGANFIVRIPEKVS